MIGAGGHVGVHHRHQALGQVAAPGRLAALVLHHVPSGYGDYLRSLTTMTDA